MYMSIVIKCSIVNVSLSYNDSSLYQSSEELNDIHHDINDDDIDDVGVINSDIREDMNFKIIIY